MSCEFTPSAAKPATQSPYPWDDITAIDDTDTDESLAFTAICATLIVALSFGIGFFVGQFSA